MGWIPHLRDNSAVASPGADKATAPRKLGFATERDLSSDHWRNGYTTNMASDPSGHAAFAAASAIVLAQLVPAKRDAIFTQARTFAENRIVLGVHYPSDIASGWTAGTLTAYVMMRDRAFLQDFAAAKRELGKSGL